MLLHLLQPIATVLIGIAMAGYGLIHALTRFPGAEAFDALAANLPAVGAVLVFAIGLVVFVVGVYLTILGVRRLRLRWRRFNRLARQTIDRNEYDEDRDWDPAYR